MKKIIIIFTMMVNVVLGFAVNRIATTYQTVLTPKDIVEIFSDELAKEDPGYVLIDYEIFTSPDQQNYAWSISDDRDSYIYERTEWGDPIYGYMRTIYIQMRNGFIYFNVRTKSDGRIGGKLPLNGYSDYVKQEVNSLLRDTISKYITESKKWLDRYKKSYSQDEIEALELLKTIKAYPKFKYKNY